MLARFYQIVDHTDWLEKFLPLGLKLVQLRIKDKTQSELRAQIKTAQHLCDEHNCQLIINDYWQLAIECGCNYVHLGQEDLDDADLTAIRSAGLKLGVSTHDGAELQRALQLKPDYIALGPVYHTILKAMKWQPQGLEKITRWRELVHPVPLVAIGGITCERGPGVWSAGADSICVVTDVLLNDNPEQRLQQWLHLAAASQAQMPSTDS